MFAARLFALVLPPLLACSSTTPPPPSSGTPAPAAKSEPADAPSADAEPEADVDADAGKPPIAADAKAEVGKPAPDFTLVDLDGEPHTLAQHAGKLVVLEWFNPECPFVKQAHGEGALKTLAAEQVAEGVVWLAVNSNAPGKQGNDVATNRKAADTFGMKHPILRDETGAVGRAYGAEKTPHMFVIDTKGVLQYAGGLDNAPFGEPEGELRSHLMEALADVRAGTPVRQPTAPPWGCTVKYAG